MLLSRDVDARRWISRAIWLAWGTILYNLAEGFVSIGFGIADESIALFGFGADSLVEVASATLVLLRFRGEVERGSALDRTREKRATLGIGVLFVVLAALTVAASAAQLAVGGHPDTTVPGIVISGLSLSFMYFLWSAKRRAATALDSSTVERDAACSRACIQLSCVLLVGSLLYAFVPSLFWADAVAAIVLSLLIGREGVETIRSARRPDFDGGCGCH